ncbi:MAG: biotin/lipoyl-binding protein, partial [Lachnospiraceae bacterium]|nr:biotin/lipoyl-binding protein [Lachnospiraceae bacterium]
MKFFKKHKKGLIILLIIAAVVTGIVIWFKSAVNRGMNILNAAMSKEVAEAQRRDIVSVVSATGKITSIDSKNVTTTATGAKVLEVKVVEGDEVKAGDVIAILDSSSYEDNLKTLEDNLANSKKSSNLSISSAKRQLDEAVTNSNASNDKVNTQVEDLEKKLEDYKNLRDQAKGIYEQAVKNRVAAEAAYKQALALQTGLAGQIQDVSGTDVSANEERAALETQLAEIDVASL